MSICLGNHAQLLKKEKDKEISLIIQFWNIKLTQNNFKHLEIKQSFVLTTFNLKLLVYHLSQNILWCNIITWQCDYDCVTRKGAIFFFFRHVQSQKWLK